MLGSSTTDILGQTVAYCVGLSYVYYRVLSHPWHPPLRCQWHTPVVMTKNIYRHCQTSPAWMKSPPELRTTELKNRLYWESLAQEKAYIFQSLPILIRRVLRLATAEQS